LVVKKKKQKPTQKVQVLVPINLEIKKNAAPRFVVKKNQDMAMRWREKKGASLVGRPGKHAGWRPLPPAAFGKKEVGVGVTLRLEGEGGGTGHRHGFLQAGEFLPAMIRRGKTSFESGGGDQKAKSTKKEKPIKLKMSQPS